MRKRVVLLSSLLVLALIFCLPASGSVSEEKKEKSESVKEEKPYVYTNEDLEKFSPETKGEEESAEEEVTDESVEEAIKKITQPEHLRLWKEARLKAAEDKVKAAEQELDYLNKKKASIENPFLPRPEITEKDQQEEASLDNVKRLERTEKQLEEAWENLKKAEEELENLKGEMRDAGV